MIGVLVSGEGTNLQALIDDGLSIAAVASNRREAPALERARAAGIPTAVFPAERHDDRDARDQAMAEWLLQRGVEWVVLAGYMQLLRPAFLDRFPGRVINVHPALLPQFPGTHAIEDALAAGVRETGATVHYVDDGVDTGPVIAQQAVPIETDDPEQLHDALRPVEHALLTAAVKSFG